MDTNPTPDDNQKQDPEPWDEEMAQWYVAQYGDHPTNHKSVEMANLQPTDHVLDTGCGSGAAVREAARRVISGTVTGVDPSPAMIRIAKEKTDGTSAAGRIRYLVGSAESLPVEAGTINVALAINSVHHWYNLAAGLAEIQRVLVPGGQLIIGEEAPTEDGVSSEEGDFLEDIGPVQLALEEAGFLSIRLTQHPLAGGRMHILQATFPKNL